MIKKYIIGFLGKQKINYYLFSQFSTQIDPKQQKENEIASIITQKLQASFVKVTDNSEGSACGVMYKMVVESPLFQGKTKVEQHQLVHQAIKEQLKGVHGFNLQTKVPITKK